MKYGSVCSGIESATAAWHPLGWKAAWFSEIEKFPSSVLKHHYPNVPNLGDMTKFKGWPNEKRNGAIDLLVGGTPCQSFSVAGLRKGLDDPRGNLVLTFLGIADKYRPRWLVWENVPGVLSSNKGKDFGTFLGALGQLGYGFAYRVLDAQNFGVPQRRRRVFVVGHLGNWRRAAAVLFERHSLQGNIAPGRKAGERIALTVSQGAPFSSPTLNCAHEQPILLTMREGKDGGGKGPLLQVDRSATLATGNGQVLFSPKSQVRRLTPMECERLQGFPDGYTDIPGAKDSNRYKALGNSMAVPVMAWIGKRIQTFEAKPTGGTE